MWTPVIKAGSTAEMTSSYLDNSNLDPSSIGTWNKTLLLNFNACDMIWNLNQEFPQSSTEIKLKDLPPPETNSIMNILKHHILWSDLNQEGLLYVREFNIP